MKINDSDLIKQTIAGNIEAFGTLVMKYQNVIYGFAFHQVKNFSDAQDIPYGWFDNIKETKEFQAFLQSIKSSE